MQKSDLRKKLLAKRRALSAEDRARFGHLIVARVLAQAEWSGVRTLGCYLHLADEVPTDGILRAAWAAGKRVAAPVTNMKTGQLTFYRLTADTIPEPGPLGIRQPTAQDPVPPEEMDMLLVPGIGFDESGYRLGYGRGLFDRYLAGNPALSVGLAFECQLVAALPHTSCDVPVIRVITEHRRLLG